MTFVFDTNVYVALIVDPELAARSRALLDRVMRHTYLSSVVLAELLQGARGDLARTRLRRGLGALVRTERVVAPTHADWDAAATAQGRVWDRMPNLRTETLLHDGLIAASARRIGATVVTENVADFALLRPHLAHRAVTLAELRSVSE